MTGVSIVWSASRSEYEQRLLLRIADLTERGLHADMTISDDETGLDVHVTEALQSQDAAALTNGRSPLRLTPPGARAAP